MSKINNLDFAALMVSGENYLKWALDIKIALRSKGLGDCIEADNHAPSKDRYKAISLMRHHLAEPLKDQYLIVENPLDLWTELKNRYDHQRTVALPQARFDWKNLRFQDFKSVDEYNSALFKIVAILRLCGDVVTERDLLEKTLSTFHTSNMVLQEQYRERNFQDYSSLISCLLLAEKNNQLLVLNSKMRPPGTAPIPEANKVEGGNGLKESNESNFVQNSNNRGRRRYRTSGQRNDNRDRGRGGYQAHGNHGGYQARGARSGFNRGRGRSRGIQKPQRSNRSVCLRCGMDNHWARTCRTPKHLADLYKEKQRKNPEANTVDGEGDFDYDGDDLMEYETSEMLQDKEE